MTGKIIIKNAVIRKPGFLYYIDGLGNICESKMSRGKKKKNKDVKKKVINTKKTKKGDKIHNGTKKS